MRKILLISLAVAVAIGLATTVVLNAHTPRYYGDEGVKVDIKNIDKGIQITVTSDDPEITRDIQENARWYSNIPGYGYHHHPHSYGQHRYGYDHGCGDWYR